jgi:hypothetical protein
MPRLDEPRHHALCPFRLSAADDTVDDEAAAENQKGNTGPKNKNRHVASPLFSYGWYCFL